MMKVAYTVDEHGDASVWFGTCYKIYAPGLIFPKEVQ